MVLLLRIILGQEGFIILKTSFWYVQSSLQGVSYQNTYMIMTEMPIPAGFWKIIL